MFSVYFSPDCWDLASYGGSVCFPSWPPSSLVRERETCL